MKLLTKRKDGGQESTVTGYWLIEIKCLFSICLLKFEGRSRDVYHTHAFNCFSWVLRGALRETFVCYNYNEKTHKASWLPFMTRRGDFHKVDSVTPVTWVLSFRGPWAQRWQEYDPKSGSFTHLTHGRVEL